MRINLTPEDAAFVREHLDTLAEVSVGSPRGQAERVADLFAPDAEPAPILDPAPGEGCWPTALLVSYPALDYLTDQLDRYADGGFCVHLTFAPVANMADGDYRILSTGADPHGEPTICVDRWLDLPRVDADTEGRPRTVHLAHVATVYVN
jgi:hypothetical protein